MLEFSQIEKREVLFFKVEELYYELNYYELNYTADETY